MFSSTFTYLKSQFRGELHTLALFSLTAHSSLLKLPTLLMTMLLSWREDHEGQVVC